MDADILFIQAIRFLMVLFCRAACHKKQSMPLEEHLKNTVGRQTLTCFRKPEKYGHSS
jgi:hypothetical protein